MAGRFGEKREKLFHGRPSGEKRDHFFCVRFIGSGGEFLREVAFGEGVIGRAVRFQDFFCEMPAVLRIGCDDDAADFLSGRGRSSLMPNFGRALMKAACVFARRKRSSSTSPS